MLQSDLFTKTSKTISEDEKSVNAQLLTRGGFVDKLMAGVYTLLPLGLRVFKKIEKIIREEMDRIGGQEILMPALHPKEPWEKTGRWQDFGGKEMIIIKSQTGKEYALGWTHEEIITPLVQKYVKSYKDLPKYIYQIQDKFRDELRAKSGLLRGREFVMKDLYSFHKDEADLEKYYDKVKIAYHQIFDRCGLGEKTYYTFASGGSFSEFSHEFQTATPAGEDIIHICQKCNVAINNEIKEKVNVCPECGSKDFRQEKAIEVGNIFKLGTKYSKPFDFTYTNEKGEKKPIVMGCYGIGLGRVMGTIAEVYHDSKGLTWPLTVAPFIVHLIKIKSADAKKEAEISRKCSKFYQALQRKKIEVIYDNREDVSAGEKFSDADLIGIPIRMVISEKSGDKVEWKARSGKEVELISAEEALGRLKDLEADIL